MFRGQLQEFVWMLVCWLHWLESERVETVSDVCKIYAVVNLTDDLMAADVILYVVFVYVVSMRWKSGLVEYKDGVNVCVSVAGIWLVFTM